MLVTVVMPAYNASLYIERTMHSIMQQTHRDLEIIIVNDGSTDNTYCLAKAAAEEDQRIQIISVPNGGVARARNIGIQAASADLIAFIDADDLWHPTKIERQIECLSQYGSDYAACYVMHRVINLSDQVTDSRPVEPVSGYILSRHLYAHFVGNGSSILVRRQVAQEVGGYEPSYADAGIGGCEDLDFELKIAARYQIAAIPSYLVGYRVYEGNMSSNRRRMARSMLATTREHLEANPTLPRFARRSALGSAFVYCVWLAVSERNVTRATGSIGRLLMLDPERGFDLILTLGRLLVRGLRKRVIRYFARTEKAESMEYFLRFPMFYDMLVDEYSGKAHGLDLERIRKLGEIDCTLWQRLARNH